MVVSYELAQLSTTARNLPRAGAALLVLGSGNVDEVLGPQKCVRASVDR